MNATAQRIRYPAVSTTITSAIAINEKYSRTTWVAIWRVVLAKAMLFATPHAYMTMNMHKSANGIARVALPAT